MVDWKLLSPIIGTLLSGGILISSIGFFYSEFINQPNILIKVTDAQDQNGRGVIELSNLGWNPANNFEMQIVSPKNVSSVRVESSENLTTFQNENDSKIVRATMPRFVQGEGSVSKLFLKLDTNDPKKITEKDYNIYSTFDEGSSIILHRPTPGEWYGSLDYFYNNLPPEYYKSFLGGGIRNLVIWTLFFSSVLILFLYFIYLFVVRRRRTSFVNKINKQIRIVGMKLSGDSGFIGSFRSSSDPTIHGKKVELEAQKYAIDTQLYTHASRWNWVHNWSLPRYPIWDLWYTESDDFKSRAFPLEKYEHIHKFFTLLTERELLITFNEDLLLIPPKIPLPQLKEEIRREYDAFWPINKPFDTAEGKYKKKLYEMLKHYISRIGRSKLKMVFDSLEREPMDLEFKDSKSKIGSPFPQLIAIKARQQSDIEALESLCERLKVISETETIEAIKRKNTELVSKFRLITNLAITPGSQEPPPPEYIK